MLNYFVSILVSIDYPYFRGYDSRLFDPGLFHLYPKVFFDRLLDLVNSGFFL